MEVFLVGIGHCFGFRYLAGDVGGFAQLVYEFHVSQYLPGVAVHVFFQLFEHGRGAVECEKRILFSQLEFLADGGYFLGLVEVVDNAFLYIILRQVFFFRSQLLADTFQFFFEILDHFVRLSVTDTAVFLDKLVHQDTYGVVGDTRITGSIADVQQVTGEAALYLYVFQSTVAVIGMGVIKEPVDVIVFVRAHICFQIGYCLIFARFVDQFQYLVSRRAVFQMVVCVVVAGRGDSVILFFRISFDQYAGEQSQTDSFQRTFGLHDTDEVVHGVLYGCPIGAFVTFEVVARSNSCVKGCFHIIPASHMACVINDQ